VLVAHAGRPLAPHELWSSWNLDPLLLGALALVAVVYARGRRRSRAPGGWQAWCFWLGLAALAVAVLSPLEPLSGVLASAHMVQHLLLVLVAAPLLAASAPAAALLRGSPSPVRRALPGWRNRRLGALLRGLRNPVVVWLLHVAALWLWHAAVLYDAALAHRPVHALEHVTFLVTAVLFWRVVVGPRAVRVPAGVGVLLAFAMSLQNALLSLLLTFAGTPWYSGYAVTTQAWGLEQLADQHLAGAIMWVPAGLVHLGVALTLLVGWLRATQDAQAAPAGEVAATAGAP
jgi:putative membrane protein